MPLHREKLSCFGVHRGGVRCRGSAGSHSALWTFQCVFSSGPMELGRMINHINHYQPIIAQWFDMFAIVYQFSWLSQVEKDGRRISNLLEGSAFGEMAVLGLTSGQSVTIKAWSRRNSVEKSRNSCRLIGRTHVRLAVLELL